MFKDDADSVVDLYDALADVFGPVWVAAETQKADEDRRYQPNAQGN